MKSLPVHFIIVLFSFVLFLLNACQVNIQANEILFSVSTQSADLRRIDPSTGSTISSVSMLAQGMNIFGGTGLAVDPTTGKLWAILKTAAEDETPRPRTLATINPITGAATIVGNTGDSFAGIAFDAVGTLYGVTGDGGSQSESLFTLNKLNGTASLLISLGEGGDGEEIAFNPNDGLLYHASGVYDEVEDDRIFETIDLAALTTTPVPLSGYSYDEITAMTYDSSGEFIAAVLDESLINLSSGGEASFIEDINYVAGGLAIFTPELPGDINLDGTVNADDLAEFVKYYGTTSDADWLSGDFNTDGITGLADLLLLKQNFEQPNLATNAVPEPPSSILSVLGIISLTFMRRKNNLLFSRPLKSQLILG